MQFIFGVVRTFAVLFFMLYSSWSDYRTREVSNTVWLIFAPLALVTTLAELLLYNAAQLPAYGMSFGITAAISLALFYTGGFGGADAKALMCIALALPFYPSELSRPLSGDISPTSMLFFPITVFSNGVILAAASTVYILLRNVIWRFRTGKKLFESDLGREFFWRKLIVLLTGYRMPILKVKQKWHLYPLEDVEANGENGLRRKLIVVPKDEGRNATVERLELAAKDNRIDSQIWASPGLPMLIFIAAGFLIALLYGDVIWTFIRLLLS